MPKAIFLMKWSAKRGPVVQGSYPPENPLEKNFLIDVLGSIIQEEEERIEGFYPITLEGRNVISYYSGEELNQVFGILLESEENEKTYRGGLVQATARILKKGGSISTTEEWEELWNWIVAYPDMSREHRIRDAFSDPSMNTILSIMAESGVLTIDELTDRAGIRTGLSRDVVTTYVHILEALGILETHWDEEALEERVYMLRDLLYYRKKPETFGKIKKKVPKYNEKLNTYLKKYKRDMTWKEDRKEIPQLLSQPGVYKVIERVRENGVVDRQRVNNEISETANRLVKKKILGETDDQFYLFTLPTLKLVFPKYTISRVLARARDEELSKEEVLEFLRTLRESYL